MKTVHDAQAWIVTRSFWILTILAALLLILPYLNYPLSIHQAQRLLQIVLPPFIGYLTSATHFAVRPPEDHSYSATHRVPRLIPLIMKGSITAFSALVALEFISFYLANSPSLKLFGQAGQTVDEFAWFLSVAVGLLSATTSILVAYLFNEPKSQSAE